MALAILKYDRRTETYLDFSFDIGTNKYYAYIIGDKEILKSNGLSLIKNKQYVSALSEPLDETAMGKGMLRIDAGLFDGVNKYLQLFSFQSRQRKGPAISDIVRAEQVDENISLPDISFSKSNAMHYSKSVSSPALNVPFRYRENVYSAPMFWQSLLQLIPTVLPAITNLLGGSSGSSGSSGTGSASTGGNTVLNNLSNPETINLIRDLINRITGAATPSTPATTVTPASPSTAHSAGYSYPKRYHSAVSANGGYSEAKIAPALLAALPALMPLLQQVLSPETIRNVLDAPQRMIGAVTEGITNVARVGIESHEQDLRHLREINPGVDDPALMQLLASMSIAIKKRKELIPYKRLESVKIKFDHTAPIQIHGTEKLLYLKSSNIAFPLSVTTPRLIKKAIIQLTVKNPENLEILIEKKIRIGEVLTGPLAITPFLTKDELTGLQEGEQYLVSIHLIWKNKAGENLGATMGQIIFITGEYVFDQMDEGSDLIPLNDINKYREFWHKVWADTFTEDNKKFILDCKYYFTLEKNQNQNGRMETLTRIEESELSKTKMKLKSGMALSAGVLNQLITKISNYPQLNNGALAAIKSMDMVSRFSQAARTQLEIKGRPGESAALWCYPEMRLHKMTFRKSQGTNPNGAITSLSEEIVYFPMPAMIHLIGVKSEK